MKILKTNLFVVHSVTDYKITVRVPILKFSVIVLYDASNNWEKNYNFQKGRTDQGQGSKDFNFLFQIYPHLMKTSINTAHIGLSIIFLTTQKSVF